MGILAPLALALLALALPIIALYLLRPRRPPAPVSSLLLWNATLADIESNAPWQRLRRNWLLLLQLAILALVALALARPVYRSGGASSGNLIVVLDGSASMRATDVTPNRFERARAAARSLVDRLGVDQRMAILLAGPVAEVRQPPTGDRALLQTALDRVEPGAGLANWDDAIALANAAGQRLPGGEIVILSDGAFPPLDTSAVALPTRVETFGDAADNLAITALSAQVVDGRSSIFVRVRNAGPSPAGGLLSIYADDRLVDARALTLAGGADTGVTVDGAVAPGEIVRAEFEARDWLAEDNRAWLAAPLARRALLVTPAAPGFLQRGLALLPETMLFSSTVSESGYDWFVYNGVAPDRLPGPSLLINPPAGQPYAPVGGVVDRPTIASVMSDHPLLTGVELGRLSIAQASRLETPAWAEVVAADAGGTPLLLAGKRDGLRVVILAFDLHASDLPLDVAFPVLLANIQGWLLDAGGVTTGSATRYRPGDVVALPVGGEIDEIVATLPDGRRRTIGVVEGAASLADTGQLGAYRLSYRQGGQERRAGWLVVNLLSEEESSITPAVHPPIGGVTDWPPASVAPPQEEIWRPLLAIGFALLLTEWLLFYGGGLRRWWLQVRRGAAPAVRRRR